MIPVRLLTAALLAPLAASSAQSPAQPVRIDSNT
jgi:hypothetical protein